MASALAGESAGLYKTRVWLGMRQEPSGPPSPSRPRTSFTVRDRSPQGGTGDI